jgi:hypothetical protein
VLVARLKSDGFEQTAAGLRQQDFMDWSGGCDGDCESDGDGEDDVMGTVVSAGREDAQSAKFRAADDMGGESTGRAGTLATRSLRHGWR